jgi:uncharacterized CHY-type Zn-finger protein
MKITIATETDLDPRGIICGHCRKLLSIWDDITQTHMPKIEKLVRDSTIAFPNFG